jgi:hypothetical protein
MTDKFTIPAFEKVYTTKETAVRLKVSESFLAKKRVSGGGPKFIKVGRVVRYPETAINEYLSAQLRASTSDTGPASGTRDDAALTSQAEGAISLRRRHRVVCQAAIYSSNNRLSQYINIHNNDIRLTKIRNVLIRNRHLFTSNTILNYYIIHGSPSQSTTVNE